MTTNINYTLEDRIETADLNTFMGRAEHNLDLIIGTAAMTLLYPNPLGIAAVLFGLYLYNRNNPQQQPEVRQKINPLELKIRYLVQKYREEIEQYKAEFAETLLAFGVKPEETEKYLKTVFAYDLSQVPSLANAKV